MAEDFNERARREMREIENDRLRRQGFIPINFGDLKLGGQSTAFGFNFGWPEFLGFLAFWVGVLIGRDGRWLFGLFCFVAVWLPLRVLISGALFLLGKFGGVARGDAKALPPLLAWPLLGAAGGALLGALLPQVLGDDIAPLEGVTALAPLGIVAGLAIGALRRKRDRTSVPREQ